jgi:hypothetical protein
MRKVENHLQRRPHPTDKRVRLVFLTERGKQIRPLAMAAHARRGLVREQFAGPFTVGLLAGIFGRHDAHQHR